MSPHLHKLKFITHIGIHTKNIYGKGSWCLHIVVLTDITNGYFTITVYNPGLQYFILARFFTKYIIMPQDSENKSILLRNYAVENPKVSLGGRGRLADGEEIVPIFQK